MNKIQEDRDAAEEIYVYKLFFIIEMLDRLTESIFRAIINCKPDKNMVMTPRLQALHQVLKTLELKKLQVKEEIPTQKMENLEEISMFSVINQIE